MAKLSILAGTTSKLIKLFFQNSSVTTGAGLIGIVGTSSGLTGYYIREGGTADVSMTLTTGTLGVYSGSAGGGLVAVDSTGMPGFYEFSVPNAAIGTGAASVAMMFQGATNLAPCLAEIELTAWNNQSTGGGLVDVSANLVQVLGTAIPSPNVPGVPVVDTTYLKGGTSAGTAGYAAIDWGHIASGTSSNNLSNTTIQNINGTAAATFSGTAAANIVAVTGTAVPASPTGGYLVVAPDWAQIVHGTATNSLGNTTVQAVFGGTAAANVVAVGGTAIPTPAAGGYLTVAPDWAQVQHGTATNNLSNTTVNASFAGTAAANVVAINSSGTAATQLALAAQKIGNATVGSGSTTTSIVTSALVPSIGTTGQFNGRIVIFDINTTTAALRGQATVISGDNGSNTLTVSALTAAPVSGDTFTIT